MWHRYVWLLALVDGPTILLNYFHRSTTLETSSHPYSLNVTNQEELQKRDHIQ